MRSVTLIVVFFIASIVVKKTPGSRKKYIYFSSRAYPVGVVVVMTADLFRRCALGDGLADYLPDRVRSGDLAGAFKYHFQTADIIARWVVKVPCHTLRRCQRNLSAHL